MENKEFRRKFGLKIKSLRAARGLTQEEFAELVDLTSHQISAIERGLSSTRLWNAWQFAEHLHVDFMELFDWLPLRRKSSSDARLSRVLEKLRKRVTANETVTLNDLAELIAVLNKSER